MEDRPVYVQQDRTKGIGIAYSKTISTKTARDPPGPFFFDDESS